MLPKRLHIPGKPSSDEPPDDLVELSENISHPLVKRTGITCTEDGQWALYVTVPKTVEVPIPEVESRSKGFPVVYEAEPDEPLLPLNSPETGT